MMLTYRERWETTITSDGKVSQEGYAPGPRPRKISKSLMLSKRDLLELHAKVKEANFFRLKKQYLLGEPHQHSGGLRFRATVNGQTHEVSIVYGIPEVKPPDDLKRFMMLWDEVLKKVPPPRRVQKTE